jgi:hypothetical protein
MDLTCAELAEACEQSWETKTIFSTQKALDRGLKILALSLPKGRAPRGNYENIL